MARASGVPRLFPTPHEPRRVLCVIKATGGSPALTLGRGTVFICHKKIVERHSGRTTKSHKRERDRRPCF